MAAVNVDAVVSAVVSNSGSVALVGSAVLLIYVGIRAFQWLRGALGGSGFMTQAESDKWLKDNGYM